MSVLQSLFRQPLVIRAGWTLVHFLWQGSVVAILLAALRGAAGAWLGARARYALSCMAMAAMCAAPPVTFAVLGTLDASALPRPVWQMEAGGGWERALPWVVVAWFCGAALFSARVAVGWRTARRLRNAAIETPPPEWQESLERLVRRMKVSAPVHLLLSPLATAPAVVGWLKPVIVMPVEAMIGMPLDQVRSLLAHELAHIRRNDYLVNILQSMAEALLFYHPAVWWVSGQIRMERELCCDDVAVEASGDVLTYVTALAALETSRRARLRAAMAADGGSLLTRIRRLAGETDAPPRTFPGAGAALALALLWLAGAGAVAVQASQPQPARALQVFAPPEIATAPQMSLAPPPPAAMRRAPLVSALLFNPFLALPQALTPPASAADDAEKKLASLSGSVFSTSGKPVEKATVRLVPANMAAGTAVSLPPGAILAQGSSQSAPKATTGADGKFSLERVPPGSYTVVFQHKDFLTATYGARPDVLGSTGTVITLEEGGRVTGIDMKVPETATFLGKIVDEDGEPVAHADVTINVTQYYYGRKRAVVVARSNSKDNGEFSVSVAPGRYYLIVTDQPNWTASDRAPVPAVKPGQKFVRPGITYWNGGRTLADATQIDIGPGEKLDVGNFRMLNSPVLHVRGKVRGDPALLQGARVVRVPGPGFALGWSYGADIRADGSFDMANMFPAQHSIAVYSMNKGYLGWEEINLTDGEDAEKVEIAAAATPLSGSVSVEDASAGSQPASQPPAMPSRIELTSTGWFKVTVATSVKPDGAFSFSSVPPGTYFVNVAGLPGGSYVKTARQHGRDVLNQPLDWGGNTDPLEIAISRKAPVLQGSVSDSDGHPLPGTVTLVPDPPRPGQALLYPKASADQNGQFHFSSVAPGSYRVLAWESVPDTATWNAEFIEPFLGLATRIDLKEADQQTLVLKRISLDSMQDTLRRAGQ